jgi:hypothetical protein
MVVRELEKDYERRNQKVLLHYQEGYGSLLSKTAFD